ncbi:MAG: hypothetical protein NT098_04460 [Candidatus Parcubacteria bacterium]|nr:hypothetical protein [Candidatus Parcubacteria bacterium]
MFFKQTKIQRENSEKILSVFLFLFLVCFPAASFGENVADGTTPTANPEEELRDKILQKNSELDQIKAQIDTYQKQLDFTQKETKTLQNTVKAKTA